MKIMPKNLLRMNLQFFAEPEDKGGATPPADPIDPVEHTEPEKKYSDDEVNRIIDEKFAKWQAQTEKEKAEVEKLAKLSEDEKTAYEIQKRDEKIAEYERKETLNKMSETASEMLAGGGVIASKNVLGLLVTDDAETTSSNVKAYLEAIDNEREAIKADFEKRLGSKETLGGNTSLAKGEGAFGKELAERNKTEVPKKTYFK